MDSTSDENAVDTALQRSENGGKEDELAGGVPGRHEQRRCGAEEMPSRTSCNCQSQQAGAGKSRKTGKRSKVSFQFELLIIKFKCMNV